MRTLVKFACVVVVLAGSVNAQHGQPSSTGGPVDWIYAVDTSLTMLGHGRAEGKNIFSDVKNVMLSFLAQDVRAGDTVRLISFDRDTVVGDQVFIGSDSAKDTVRQRILTLEARGQDTYIAKAVSDATALVAGQQVTGDRTSIAVIFTDGIDEPPASATTKIDLTQALRGFPRSNAFFYFINLGTTDATNDLYNAFMNAGFGDSIRNHPNGVSLRTAKIPRPPNPLFLNVKELQSPVALPEKPVTWEPFDVTSSRPVDSIAIEAQAPERVRIEPIAPLRGGDHRPRVTVTVPRTYKDRDVPVQFKLRPSEDAAATVDVTSRLLFHAPTLLERLSWLLWVLATVLAAASGGIVGYRWWTTPPLVGTLLTRIDGRTEALNLRHLNASRVLVGHGGQVLGGERGFQMEIAVEGTRQRIERVTATLRNGTGTLNRLPLRIGETRTVHHDDAFELERGPAARAAAARHAVMTYENFRIEKSS
jgi:hypothetical protein